VAFHKPFQVIGFHSCDRELGLRLLVGDDRLKPSKNPWDWLGPGVYFWEQNPGRALEYAIDCANGNQVFNGAIRNPFVIGAIIELGHCLNLVEPISLNIVKAAHSGLEKILKESNEKIPRNKGANRVLDCAVIRYLHHSNETERRTAYQTIRSPFHEGGTIYDGSNFTDRLHIEICVIDPSMIKGYFLPLPTEEFNPYLKKDFIPLKKG
jgi:hypothetical protein